MRALIQRVSEASVTIENSIFSSIKEGLLILIGVEEEDNCEDIDWLSKKIYQLRIFGDENGLMNKSLVDNGGSVLIVSQFTLHAMVKKGNRPSFIKAARPEKSIPLYEEFCKEMIFLLGDDRVKTGVFGADMKVSLINDGPVTIWIDTKNKE
jgi:D-tyrosyl-tRNA(Tyr) deacylase